MVVISLSPELSQQAAGPHGHPPVAAAAEGSGDALQRGPPQCEEPAGRAAELCEQSGSGRPPQVGPLVGTPGHRVFRPFACGFPLIPTCHSSPCLTVDSRASLPASSGVSCQTPPCLNVTAFLLELFILGFTVLMSTCSVHGTLKSHHFYSENFSLPHSHPGRFQLPPV